jgi:Glycosyl hydrolase family 26
MHVIRSIPPRRLFCLLAGVALASLLSGCIAYIPGFISSGPPPPRQLARLEPTSGTYFGVNLDFGRDSAVDFAQRLGKPPAVYVAFAHFPIGDAEAAYVDSFMGQVQQQGGLALLTLEPYIPLTAVTPEMAAQFANQLAGYNANGIPVMVRFAHEMNGSWYPWSQQPAAYISAFRTIAQAVHERASKSAMLWAPNYGAGYPFTGGDYEAAPGTADFAQLDTDGNGRLDDRDDPYAPFYPGDDAVDWVGMTLYHWGDRWPWGKNIVPESGKFVAQLTGTYNGAGGDQRAVPDFYHQYAEGHSKPLAIPETAALYNPAVGGDAELDIKQAWWRQVFSEDVALRFPALKMINWFEWRKPEAEVNNAVIDWTSTLDPAIRAAFVADLPADRLLYGSGEPQEPGGAETLPVQTISEPVATSELDSRTIAFAGYNWLVRESSNLEGPGPNYFASTPDYAWTDEAGRLHLRIAPGPDGRWYAAEVITDRALGYGTYQFVLDSRVDNLDLNAAIGLFTWSDDEDENHRELDIEFAHFGVPDAPLGRYTRQPYTDAGNVSLFDQPATPASTHQIQWKPDRVAFSSWIDGDIPGMAGSQRIAYHTFEQQVPDPGDARVHINLWLDAGKPPTDGQPIEVIVRDFKFSSD